MNFTRHTTISITEAGEMERRSGQLPAAICQAPIRVTITDGTDQVTSPTT